jgi:hypothetical protein
LAAHVKPPLGGPQAKRAVQCVFLVPSEHLPFVHVVF